MPQIVETAPPEVWKTVERPGYLGKLRDEVQAAWTRKYGQGNWRIAYEWAGGVVDRACALQLYEDAYFKHFQDEYATACTVTSTFADVYDTAESNAGQWDYVQQETPNNHIHDVAIRRALLRLGLRFSGCGLLHVRWTDSPGYLLNPGVVPFHLPALIERAEVKDYGGKGQWWRDGSIEDFYQKNKVLQVVDF